MTYKEDKLFTELTEFASSLELHLEGFIPAKCPVYVLNLSYMSKDKDPFYPIDRTIIEILDRNPMGSIAYIAWLVGFEKEIVESRITYHLIADGFLAYNNNGAYVVTDAGARKYMTQNGERPDVQVTGSIMVDGTTLKVLPQRFYNEDNSLRYYKSGKTSIPHIPLMGKDDPLLLKAIKTIERTIKASHFYYGLEENAHDLEVLSYDERIIEDAVIVFLSDSKGNISKRLYFYGQGTILDALKSVVERYYFYFDKDGNLHNNAGISREDVHDVILKTSDDSMAQTFINRYDLRKGASKIEAMKSYIIHVSGKYILHISKTLLDYSPKKRLMLADACKGHICMTPMFQESGVYIITNEPDKEILFLINFEEELIKWKEEHGQIDIAFINKMLENRKFNWRKVLCTIGRYDELENVDRKQFFKFD